MNEVVRDAIGVLVLGRDLGGITSTASSPAGSRSLRRRLTALVRDDEGRRALARIATDLLGLCDVHRLGDAALVDKLVEAMRDGQVGLASLHDRARLGVPPLPRILREVGRAPKALKSTEAAAPVVAAVAAPPPKPGKKWPPDPIVAPEYPHMARLEARAIELARITVDIALDLFMFRNIEPIDDPEVAPEYPRMAKAAADAVRDIAASIRAGLDSLWFTRITPDTPPLTDGGDDATT